MKAARKRRDVIHYRNTQANFAANGAKLTQSFEDLFPQHAEEVTLDVDEKTLKLMDTIAAGELAELEAIYEVAELQKANGK